MEKISYPLFILTVAILLVGFWARMMVIKIGIDEIGVKTLNFSFLGKKGVVPNDFDQPGWYSNIWLLHSWTKFDKRVQTLHMGHGFGNPIKIKSNDGYNVSMDITVKYKIQPGMAHKLYKLFGAGTAYKRIVENETQDTCRIVFGTINTEGFYNPIIREVKTDEALWYLRARMMGLDTAIDMLKKKIDELSKESTATLGDELLKRLHEEKLKGLASILDFFKKKKNDPDYKEGDSKFKQRYIEIVDLLIRDVAFDPQYERKIKDKALAEQDVELNKSRAEAERYKGITNKIKAEIKAMVNKIQEEKRTEMKKLEAEYAKEIAMIKADAEYYKRKKMADADLKADKMKAEAIKLIKAAEAEGEKLRNKAMAGSGGRIMVALEMAKKMKLRSVEFSTLDFNPLDINNIINKMTLDTLKFERDAAGRR